MDEAVRPIHANYIHSIKDTPHTILPYIKHITPYERPHVISCIIMGKQQTDALIAAILQGWNVEVGYARISSLELAIRWRNVAAFRILCTVLDTRRDLFLKQFTLLQFCIQHRFQYGVRLLIAIGHRLQQPKKTYMRDMQNRLIYMETPAYPATWMFQYQSSIIQVRRKVRILLCLKRRRISSMIHLDRFLVRQLASVTWSERMEM